METADSEYVMMEDDTEQFEEYEWSGQTRIRASSLVALGKKLCTYLIVGIILFPTIGNVKVGTKYIMQERKYNLRKTFILCFANSSRKKVFYKMTPNCFLCMNLAMFSNFRFLQYIYLFSK